MVIAADVVNDAPIHAHIYQTYKNSKAEVRKVHWMIQKQTINSQSPEFLQGALRSSDSGSRV